MLSWLPCNKEIFVDENKAVATQSGQVDTKKNRALWSSKWMFVLAAAASAVGLGNMWRFPYLAAKYGGGTFLITYAVLVFTFGLSLLLLEMALGRHTRQSTIGAFKAFGKKYAPIGIFAALVPFIITPYYCIIGGWVMKYMVAYFTDGATALADGGDFFVGFITGGPESFVWLLIFMAVVFGVVALGVKGGIEKANLIMMPLLIIMMIGLIIFALSQPGAVDGALYFLTPDFSKMSPELLISALGQMFYSLSLAMGIMVTYGSYVAKNESLTSSAIQVGGFDFGISFLAGLLIVPTAFIALGSADAVSGSSGPSLMFVVLPTLFADLGDVAGIIGPVFFLLVTFAALTSAISLTEACTSIVQDATKWTRAKSLGVTAAIIVVCGIFINLGYNGLSFIEPLGEGSSLLDFADFISNSVMMPIVALLTCIFVGWIIKPKVIEDEIASGSPFRARGAWRIMIKFIAPVLVIVILVAYVGATFGLVSF